MPTFFKMKDDSDKLAIKKADIWSLPMRLVIIGRTGSGKSNILGNLLLRPEYYRKDFEPENIYLFSGSLPGDKKLEIIIEELEIPQPNIFHKYSESTLEVIYDMIVEDYQTDIVRGEKPAHHLFIFDDISFSGSLRGKTKESMINKLFMNGRKYLVSTITTAQKYTDISTGARENLSGAMIYKSSNKQLELIESDLNYLNGKNNKKSFLTMMKENTIKNHDFIILDFGKDNLYYDKEFKPIDLKPYELKN